jgi:hypothetical protein
MSLNTILATAPLTATGYHLKATGTALGQSLIWDNGTNVGIGNQGTTYTFDVTGSGRYNNASAMALTVNGGTFTQATASSYSLGIGNTGGSDLTLGTSTTAGVIQTWSSKPLSLNPQGNNVLIGSTTDSSYKLDVTGTVRFTTTLLVSGAATFSSTLSAGVTTINGNSGSLVQQAATVGGDVFHEFKNSAGTRRAYLGFGGASSSLFELSNNENGDISFRANAGERLRIFSSGRIENFNLAANNFALTLNGNTTTSQSYGLNIYAGTNGSDAALNVNNASGTTGLFKITGAGNVLIGTSSDSGYKLAVASGHQYFGSGFQISGSFSAVDRQCATAFADFSGTTCTFDLASLFPRTTFLNRGLSVTMQLVALPTYTIVSSGFVVLGRTGNSNVWSSAILANININGASINSVTASGTVITVNYSTYIFGTAYINLATIG